MGMKKQQINRIKAAKISELRFIIKMGSLPNGDTGGARKHETPNRSCLLVWSGKFQVPK